MTTKGYKIDFTNNTLVMNYKFHSASQEYGTPENKLVKKILKDFPRYQLVTVRGKGYYLECKQMIEILW